MSDYNTNQIVGSSVEVDDDGIAYVEFTVSTTELQEEVTLRMNAAQAGIASSSLRNANREAEEALEEIGEGLRTLNAIRPTYPKDED